MLFWLSSPVLIQVTESEFTDILKSLTESAHVTFFQKAVDCSVPCLYLSAMLVSTGVSRSVWVYVHVDVRLLIRTLVAGAYLRVPITLPLGC